MKNGLHTLKGVFDWSSSSGVSPADPFRLILDNGDPRRAFVVESFVVMPTDVASIGFNPFPNDGTIAVLATREEGAVAAKAIPHVVRGPGFNDNRQIAWSMLDAQQQVSYVDPDHLIIEDLFLNCWGVDTSSGALEQPNQPIGYSIQLREKRIPLTQSLLALIKERAQDD